MKYLNDIESEEKKSKKIYTDRERVNVSWYEYLFVFVLFFHARLCRRWDWIVLDWIGILLTTVALLL